MGEVMRVSFDIWESDPEAFHFHNCEYIAVVPEPQDADIEAIYARQQGEGFPSTLVQGEQKVFDHMREMFPNWKARGLTSLLQEHRGGFAFNKDAINGLADKARSEGVTIYDGVQVTGFKHGSDNSVTHVETTDGDIEVGCVVSGAGPWSARVWEMLGLSDRVDVRDRDGEMHPNQPLWTYWRLEEGEITFDPSDYATAEGKMPPVFHFDSRETLISDKTGDVLSSADDLWGVYWKSDREGVQGGAEPIHLGEEVNLDPYGPDSPEHVVREDFVEFWTSGLAHALGRFEGSYHKYLRVPTGGVGCFTFDNFPIFDYAPGVPNAYVIADSNHGFKMIGVGKEVAKVLGGESSAVLDPFRFARFEEGDLHPVSASPWPWG